jgi:glucose-1-phosphate thymidylyltransferase
MAGVIIRCMDALILAGGFSTRLYPVTEYYPKALLAIGGKPIVSRVTDELVSLPGIQGIFIVSNSRYLTAFESWIQSTHPGRITLLDDGAESPDGRLGAIGDIVFAIRKERINTDLMILASDTYTSLKLKDFMAFFANHRGIVNAVFDTHDAGVIARRLGCVTTRGAIMTSFTEKPEHPESTITSIPYYIYPKESLPLLETYIKEGFPPDGSGSVFPWLLKRSDVYAFDIGEGFYYDVGTPEIYAELSREGAAS